MIDSDFDLLLVLLYAKNHEEIVGITRFEKLVFLLLQQKEFRKFQKDFKYEEYDYGPWSSQILDNLETLSSYKLVRFEERSLPIFEKDYYQDEIEINFDLIKEFHENKTIVFSLNSDGLKVAQQLFSELKDDEKSIIESIKDRFNKIPLKQLIQYVYHFYPNYTKKSRIKNQVTKLTPEEELKAIYPKITIDKRLLALVGTIPAIPLEEEKEYLRSLIREKYAK